MEKGTRDARRRRGSVMAWAALGMLPLAGIMGMGIDVANVVNAQGNLQNYVDAKAVAGLKEKILSPVRQIEVTDFLSVHFASGEEEEPIPGAWDFEDAGGTFTEGGGELSGVPAMRVAVAEDDHFEYPLFFGALVGRPSVELSAEAVAFTGKRHVVLVQDVSGSMQGQPIDLARIALEHFVHQFADQDLPGDMMGLVSFDSQAREDQAVVSVHGSGEGQLVNAIQGLSASGSTEMQAGIQLARTLFPDADGQLVNRIMVVVSDGEPNGGCDGPRDEAEHAFEDDGIHVFSVFIGSGGTCSSELPQGIGREYTAAAASDIDEILVDIVSRVPVRLVR